MKRLSGFIPVFLFALLFAACNDDGKNVSDEAIVSSPAEINNKAEEVIHQTVKDILQNKQLADSFHLKNSALLEVLYKHSDYQPIWTSDGKHTKAGDSLLHLIKTSLQYGLFPNDYHFDELQNLKEVLSKDSVKQLDASKWALLDLLLSSAFTQVVKDVKVGRILPDSVIQKHPALTDSFFVRQLNAFQQAESLDGFVMQLEPTLAPYKALRQALKPFIDSAEFKRYTYVHASDSATLRKLIYKRIHEDSLGLKDVPPDSSSFIKAVKAYQKKKKLKEDGKISPELIKKLNDTDWERFKRVVISMDKYKQMDSLPNEYIWVNIPTYFLQVKSGDTTVLTSKVVVGKTNTRTPEIVSAITDMITYPQWTIPASIIEKEILPGLKRDAGYTNRKGYSIVDKDGDVVDPYSVDWSKYKKGIPYKVVQGSGDANALGVIKFNFPNKHAVYLHDTNQRYLFSRKYRALSHGCVRVESWRDLAYYILERDSLANTTFTSKDSLSNWLEIKQKKVVPVRKRLPVFIKYFSCEGIEGKVVFHDDIYDEDRRLRNKYFATK